MTIQQTFEVASQRHQAGRLPEAERLYRQILAQEPSHAGALHHLGLIAHQVGQNDIAVDLIRRSIAIEPTLAEAHNNVGLVLAGTGKLDDAIAAFRQAVVLRPNFAEAQGNLGAALRDKGKLGEAIAACRRAIALRPDLREVHSNLCNALRDNGQLDEAMAACREAIDVSPNYSTAHVNLGVVLTDMGRLDEAMAALGRAIALGPDDAEAYGNLGNALKGAGQLDEAIAAYQRAIRLRPDYAEAHSNLSNALRDRGQLEEAIAACRAAIAIRPEFADAHNNLGVVLTDVGLLDEAMVACRQAISLKPDYAAAHSNLLYTLHYHPGYDPQTVAEEHRRWNRQHAEPLKKFIQAHSNDRNWDRRLRVGYVSPDFREHPGGRNVLALLGAHNPAQVETFCYADVARPDAITDRIRSHAHQWRNIFPLSDRQLAEQIRRDRIDILVDLAGHTGGNRLLVFAVKPAPVQVTWLGYPNTTGLAAMDYRLTDALADPPGDSDTLCSERLIRLPETAWCFEAPSEDFPFVERTRTAAKPITFGSFNNFSKITTPILELWARILRSTPGSRLLIKAKALRCESVSQRVRKVMDGAGVTADRLELEGWQKSHEDHLAAYGQVDIALDTFPYHGTTTTRDALWMGVPVVTLAGQSHVSRVGISLLTNVGLPGLVAHSLEEYVQIASALARDIPRLNNLHATVRHKMEQSPLMDAARFARNFEAAYRQMWHTWCHSA